MEILKCISGEWIGPDVDQHLDVINPATAEVIGKTPLCGGAEPAAAAGAAMVEAQIY